MKISGYILRVTAIALLSCFASAAYAAKGCESLANGYVLESVTENGAVVALDDSSIWRVSENDIPTAAIWDVDANIQICNDNKLINADDGSAIHAKKIQ